MVAMGISGKETVNTAENNSVVMSWEERTITTSVISIHALSGEKGKNPWTC